MEPIIKWTGGKRSEIKILQKFFPDFIKSEKYKYVEAFAGGAAVYFHLNNPDSIINDFDYDLINFYKVYSEHSDLFVSELQRLNSSNKEELSKEYYLQRIKDRNGELQKLNPEDRAIRFYVLNQLGFHGMHRVNKKNENNIPYGLYKHLDTTKILNNTNAIKLLRSTQIINGDFQKVLQDNDTENTFIFLDPPYISKFKEYTPGNIFDIEHQKRLAETFKSLKKASVMIVINKCTETEELYKDYIKSIYNVRYDINVKNRIDGKADHLIITNY